MVDVCVSRKSRLGSRKIFRVCKYLGCHLVLWTAEVTEVIRSQLISPKSPAAVTKLAYHPSLLYLTSPLFQLRSPAFPDISFSSKQMVPLHLSFDSVVVRSWTSAMLYCLSPVFPPNGEAFDPQLQESLWECDGCTSHFSKCLSSFWAEHWPGCWTETFFWQNDEVWKWRGLVWSQERSNMETSKRESGLAVWKSSRERNQFHRDGQAWVPGLPSCS